MARARGRIRNLIRAYTVGHGTLPIEDFLRLLQGAGIVAVADIRRFPGSRRNPQFGADALRTSLEGAGLLYAAHPELGGRRRPDPDSKNLGLRNEAFRAYADFMQTSDFSSAIAGLLGEMHLRPMALMCAESLPWRCHRRLVADYLALVHECEIYDLFHTGRLQTHRLTPGVMKADGGVRYAAEDVQAGHREPAH
ncbi:MAG: DUF488 domain-containing protein [Candidatus Eremiobacteraeota bacterium]|nr:DUF488 domain-containing protein [Candidatus Eremiobacteraeota bacterium]